MLPAETVTESLRVHADRAPDGVAFRVVSRTPEDISRGRLWGLAGAVGNRFGPRGQRIAIACDDTVDFIIALTAALASGNVAVPIPMVLSRRSAPRAEAILAASRPDVLVTGSAAVDWLAGMPAARGCRVVDFDRRTLAIEPPGPVEIGRDDPALIQFSSGSTGEPKGIALTHGNIAANCRDIRDTYGFSDATRMVSWLPLHHDMGLIGHVVFPMWMGCRSTLMDPLRFLQRPLSWLRLIQEERGTITSAPNFAYEMCTRAAERAGLGDLDLSSLAVAICGGEPVLPSTVRRFLSTFGAAGFRTSAFAPSYGLAEATLLVSSGMTARGPQITSIMGSDGIARETVDLGPTVAGLRCRIVDEAGGPAVDGAIGEIELSGDSIGVVTDGMVDGTLRTGDLGFMRAGRLHITGRRKELIILKGQNVYPADVEMAAMNAHPAIVPGGLAAIGTDSDGTQELTVLFEIERINRLDGATLAAAARTVREAVASHVGHVPKAVIPLRSGTLPRTPSGKVKRTLVAAMLAAGTLQPHGRGTGDIPTLETEHSGV